MFPPKIFFPYFIHAIPISDEFRRNVAHNKFHVHTDSTKLEGILVNTPE